MFIRQKFGRISWSLYDDNELFLRMFIVIYCDVSTGSDGVSDQR